MSRALGALLPHTGAARLLTAVSRCDEAAVSVVGEILPAHPLVLAGEAPAFLAIEIGAQAAAIEAATRQGGVGRGPVAGRLVRVRTARFLRATLPVNRPLTVTARLMAMAPPLAVYHISVSVDGVESATATLSTYATGEAEASDD